MNRARHDHQECEKRRHGPHALNLPELSSEYLDTTRTDLDFSVAADEGRFTRTKTRLHG